MHELIRAGRIYIAQPPLYQVTRKKKVEYVLNERAMRQIYTSLGLENTQLIIRDDGGHDAKSLTGPELKQVVDLLSRLEELVTVIERRGIDFGDLLGRRDSQGHLPTHRVVVDGEEHFFQSAADRNVFLREQQLLADDPEMTEMAVANPESPAPPPKPIHLRLQKNNELHETKELERIFTQLDQAGISIDDYFLTQEESVSGEKLKTRYALKQDTTVVDVAGVSQLLPEVLALGKHGIEVKRFKGLGEMNSGELWDTTLDPTKRVLLRVTLEDAGESERLFSVLMGEDVERRRQFIEDHALEVKNLDV
ncbi:MAG: hypothetical protein JO353_02350 [Phycisphaerae bacterium]|nr:hypothetical protein [Phycisphaerae bacterium]